MGSLRQPLRFFVGEPQARPPRGGSPLVGPPALEPHEHGLPHLQLPCLGLAVDLRHGGKPVGCRVRGPRPGKPESRRRFGLQRPELSRERRTSGAPRASTPTPRTSGCSTAARSRRPRSAPSAPTRRGPRPSFTSGGEPIPGTAGNLEPSTKIGGEGQIWFGPPATPFHLFLIFAHGEDNKALISGRDPQRDIQRRLRRVRLDVHPEEPHLRALRPLQELPAGRPDAPQDLNDENAITVGCRHTFAVQQPFASTRCTSNTRACRRSVRVRTG